MEGTRSNEDARERAMSMPLYCCFEKSESFLEFESHRIVFFGIFESSVRRVVFYYCYVNMFYYYYHHRKR